MISPRGQIPAIFSHVIVNGSIWGTIALRTKVSARDADIRSCGTLCRPRSLTFEGDRKAAMDLYHPFYRDYAEWNRAKERVENRLDRKDEHARDEDFEELFDAAIRHRFGVFISRAKL